MVAVFNCKMRVKWFRCDVRAGVKKIHPSAAADGCNNRMFDELKQTIPYHRMALSISSPATRGARLVVVG